MAENQLNQRHVKIVSDGIPWTSKVYVDGEPLLNVQSVTWECDGEVGYAVATMRLIGVEVEVEADIDADKIPAKVIIGKDEFQAVCDLLREIRCSEGTHVIGTAAKL